MSRLPESGDRAAFKRAIADWLLAEPEVGCWYDISTVHGGVRTFEVVSIDPEGLTVQNVNCPRTGKLLGFRWDIWKRHCAQGFVWRRDWP